MTEPLHLDALRQELADEAQRIAIDAEYVGRPHLIASEGWRRRATLVAPGKHPRCPRATPAA